MMENNNWISVKDKLPDDGQTVLVWVPWKSVPDEKGLTFDEYGFYALAYRDSGNDYDILNGWQFVGQMQMT